jgi:two-component system LytT family response regulator
MNNLVNAVILDDELHSVETLKWKLENYCPEVIILASFTDPVEGLEFLKKNTPHLLFLDIEMPLLNGFDILEELGEVHFDVIFTTAYDDFGIKAVKFSALDYLLKPIQNQELKKAVEKHLHKSQHLMGSKQLEVLFHNIREEENGKPKKIGLATKESIEFVEVQDILLCSSESNYTMVYLADGRKKLISRTLKEFEDLLTPYNFFRPHHSHLVNLAHVKEYTRTEGGYLMMSNKVSVPVSRSKKEDLLSKFEYNFL